MINIKNISFDSWYNQLKNKQVIIPNKGIGDIIISSNYAKYAECGVNYISSGALTHSVYNMDLSLKAF